MALQTLANGKMLIVTGIVTSGAGWDDPFFTGRMLYMTFRAGKILKMGGTIFCEVLYGFFMTGRAERGINRRIPVISGGLMGLMTEQTIFELHFRGVLFMTIKAGLVLTIFQAVSVMALGTVLFAMGTGQSGQLIVNVFMAGDTGRLAVAVQA